MSKVVLIGVDGATFAVLDVMAKQGRLPAISRMMDQGVRGVLNSTIPPQSPVAWTSMITGVNSDKHGIFDFPGRKPNSYEFRINTSHTRTADPIWMLMSRQGRRVMVYDVTLTYPPDPVNGIMVSGLGGPPDATLAQRIHPAEAAADIEKNVGPCSAGPKVRFRDMAHDDAPKDRFMQEFADRADYVARFFRYTWEKYQPDFAMPFFVDTDMACHCFWRFLDPTHRHYVDSKYKDAIYSMFEKLDAAVGSILQTAGPDTDVMIVSDHGFGAFNRVVFVSNWLASRGYLKHKPRTMRDAITDLLVRFGLRPPIGRETRILWSETRVFSCGTLGNIWINLKGRDPEGIVPMEQYESLCDEVRRELLTLTDPETGDKVVDRVYTGRDLYRQPGPHPTGPDLLMTFTPGWAAIGDELPLHSIRDKGQVICDSNNWSGTHRTDGVFIARGPSFKKGARIDVAQIIDVAPTVMHLMDLPVPEEMDGQVIAGALADGFLASRPVRKEKTDMLKGIGQQAANATTDEENAQVMDRLRDLGYLE